MENHCMPTWTRTSFWQRTSNSLPLEQIMSLIFQCVFWVVIFYCYRHFELFFEGRQRLARQKEHVHGYRSHSDTERDVIEKLYPDLWSSTGNTVDPTQAHSRKLGAGFAEECLDLQVPISISVDSVSAIGSLKGEASRLRALGQDVNVLQTSAGPVVQTKLELIATDAANKISLREVITMKANRFLVQLGRWRIFLPSTGGVEQIKMLKLENTGAGAVPIILHSSYSGGLLTVEGLYLKQAIIQAVTKDKSKTLETKYTAGLDGLEVFTSESALPSKNLAEVFVLASKKFEEDGHKLIVNSVAVRIQNDNLRTVLWTILPFTTLLIYATTNVLRKVVEIMQPTNIMSTVAWIWIVLCIFIVSTRALPQRMETAITSSLTKLAGCLYLTLYFAAQCGIFISNPEPALEEGESLEPLNEKKSIDTGKSASNPDWEWPIYDIIDGNLYQNSNLKRREQDKTDKTDKNDTGPFGVIYRNVKNMPWASQVQMNISSPFLIKIIKDLMPNAVDRWKACKKISLDGPELFYIYEKLIDLRDTISSEQDTAPEASSICRALSPTASSTEAPSSKDSAHSKDRLLHLNHLLRFMVKECEEMMPAYDRMKAEGWVSWDMLWASFPPKTRVVYIEPYLNESAYAEVLRTGYKNGLLQGPCLAVTVSSYDYNGSTWTEYVHTIDVYKFEGKMHIGSLKVYPIQFGIHPHLVSEGKFLETGKKFCELSMMANNCFMNYEGTTIILERGKSVRKNADGRVMIDLGSFARMNPNFPMRNAQPPCEVIRNKLTDTIDITHEKTRMFAPAIVYGFSFRTKQWGIFSVRGCSPIDFNTSAYDDLVMDETTKDVVQSLVRKQLEDGKDKEMQESDRVDSIACKGQGCTLLCYGPPGTGKTLTAESLSEMLKCPLWCLSVSELGLTPKDLEETLVQVMEVAASWGAILLLDEADIFLERRTSTDLTRNAMTGVFLRQLEYYRGVLFLTTNRDTVFDDAIRSRISMILQYGKHNEHQRRTIWTSLLDRLGLKDVPSEVLDEFVTPEFNGREIRNIVRTAHTLSRCTDDSAVLHVDYVKTAFKVYESSSRSWVRESDSAASEKTCDCLRI